MMKLKKNMKFKLKNNLFSERIRRRKTIKQLVCDYFNVAVAIDLLSKLLLFNPKKD